MAILATDTFTAADTSPATQVENLGANWTTNITTKFFKIITNAIRPVDNSNDAAARYSGITWPANHYSQVVLPTTSAAGLGVGFGVGCRWDTTGANTGYRFVMCRSGYELGRVNAGAFTSLASGAGTVVANGDTIKLECTGTGATVTLRMYKNGVQFGGDISDSSASRILSGAAAIVYSSAGGGSDNLDTFEGGSFAQSLSVDSGSLAIAGQSVILRPGSTTYLRYRK